MKLKYYLRGLAVGVLITTIVLTIANRDNRPLTDAQIRQRALELGMVEQNSGKLSSLQTEESKSGPESTQPDNSPESSVPESDEESSTEESAEESSASESGMESFEDESSEGSFASESSEESSVDESSLENTVTEGSEENPTPDGRPVVLQIRSGASSYTVSRDLAALGLVEDAAAYDQFLCDNGYSKKIHVGTYEIMPGTSEEDIAKLIAR